MNNPFYRLSPWIQDFIYRQRWQELRPVQVAACKTIFDTDHHLLLASGTASGKTEAALFPMLTMLDSVPSKSIGILYIGPLKALINDQFLRLDSLLEEEEISVWHWHGDVSSHHKNRMMNQPSGILQITPESLESFLINRNSSLRKVFCQLRFVIIDEVHVFMHSDRGRQVLCQLERLEDSVEGTPRRVGLSATLGDYEYARKWLASGTDTPVDVPQAEIGHKKIRISIEHFYLANSELEGFEPISSKDDREQQEKPNLSPYSEYLFDISRLKKCLIFSNSRRDAEDSIATLRQTARSLGYPDVYHVHHGDISTPLRETAEESLRNEDTTSVTAATVTLELGIDIGNLERIIQIGAPHSVSSFLQRLGRSGRRSNASEMFFVCREDEPSGKEVLPDQIPWLLLQAISIIQLYLEERWLEPIPHTPYPFSLLYHQTLSALAGLGELSSPQLASRILTLSPFSEITQEDFRELLLYLIKIDHVQQIESGGLIVGLTGEKIVRNYQFYGVFQDEEDYMVRDDSYEIGNIIAPPPLGTRFGLAGKTWEVIEIDPKRRNIFVQQVEGKTNAQWYGNAGEIHTRILERMWQVLKEDTEYPYLQPNAVNRLQEIRSLTKKAGMHDYRFLSLGGTNLCLFPWFGTKAWRTLIHYLQVRYKETLEIKEITGRIPYYISIKTKTPGQLEALQRAIESLVEENPEPLALVEATTALELEKYDEFVPRHLLKKAYAYNYLDLEELIFLIKKW